MKKLYVNTNNMDSIQGLEPLKTIFVRALQNVPSQIKRGKSSPYRSFWRAVQDEIDVLTNNHVVFGRLLRSGREQRQAQAAQNFYERFLQDEFDLYGRKKAGSVKPDDLKLVTARSEHLKEARSRGDKHIGADASKIIFERK